MNIIENLFIKCSHFKHEDFDETNNLNDIALFKLVEPIELNDRIQLACLPKERSIKYPPVYYDAWTMGWVNMNSKIVFNKFLQFKYI